MLTELRRTVRARGVVAATFRAARAVRQFALEVRTDLVLVKALAVGGTSRIPETLQAEVVDAPGIEWLATLPAAWRADAAIMHRFRRYIDNRFGCVLVRENGEPIGYFWWTSRDGGAFGGHPHFKRLGISLSDEDAWLFDLYVSPEHRAKGKPAVCLRLAEAEGHRRGFRRAMFCVLAENLPARALYSRLGWKTEASERAVVIGRRLLIGRFGLFIDAFTRRPHGFDFAPIVRWTLRRRAAISAVARAESRS